MTPPPLPGFKCQRCGACCRVKGGIVRLTPEETDAIAAHLNLPVSDFIANHTSVSPDRKCLVLNDAPDGACAMLTPSGACAIQPVKPAQCRNFPHSWTNPNSESYCPALKSLNP